MTQAHTLFEQGVDDFAHLVTSHGRKTTLGLCVSFPSNKLNFISAAQGAASKGQPTRRSARGWSNAAVQ